MIYGDFGTISLMTLEALGTEGPLSSLEGGGGWVLGLFSLADGS